MLDKDGEPTSWELAQYQSAKDEANRQRHLERANKLTEIRAHTLVESAKGLALINGGGAVALAALLGQIWDKGGAQPMRPYVLVAIGVLALGVGFAAVLPYIRYQNSLDERSLEIGASPWWRTYPACTILSVAASILGMGIAVCGGFRSL